jgi:hypothetical protein
VLFLILKLFIYLLFISKKYPNVRLSLTNSLYRRLMLFGDSVRLSASHLPDKVVSRYFCKSFLVNK